MSTSPRSRRLRFGFLLLEALLGAGCFSTPAVSKIICTADPTSCPSGYICTHPGVPGGCAPRPAVPDGAAASEVSQALDGTLAIDAAVDAGGIDQSEIDEPAPLDSAGDQEIVD